MTTTPTDLVLTRRFAAPIEDVWASVTEPDRTARWFGRWEGEGRPGATITVTLGFEDGSPAAEMTIVACTPPRHLELRATDEAGMWHLELELRADGDEVELVFTHHLEAGTDPGSVRAGWEYYLDNLVAARAGAPLPSFDDYWPPKP
ncbi:MAG TPA: SRPBCC family protein [Capillimicrobium sp.]|jgi:uncharacterized protein YndB with AHSA1/START domain